MRRVMVLVGVVVLSACSGSGGGAPDATAPDAVGTDAQIPGPNHVTLRALGATFVVYRDHQGLWLTPDVISGSDYDLEVTDDYEAVVACSDATGFEATLLACTFADGAIQFAFCGKGGSTPTTVAVTGNMIQPGSVWMYGSDTSAVGPWNFALEVPLGMHDLFGVSSDHILVRRNKNITAATTEPTVDVVQDGVALTTVPLTIRGTQAGDSITSEINWFTAHDVAYIHSDSSTALVPPASLVDPNDFQFLSVFAQTATTDRFAHTIFTGSETNFTLLPVLTNVVFSNDNGVVHGAWGAVPFTYTDVELSLFSAGATTSSSQRVTASKRWLDATGARRIGFDVRPPGYDPTWVIDARAPHFRNLSIADYSGSIGYWTGVSENVNGLALRMAPRRPRFVGPRHRLVR